LLRYFPVRRKDIGQLRRVLFIRPGGIGDAVMLIPAISALKKAYPQAKIDILAEKRNAAIFHLSPHISNVWAYDMPSNLLKAFHGRYDVVVDTEQWHRLSAVIVRLTGAPVSIGYSTNERKYLFTCPIPYSHDNYEVNSFFNLLEPLNIPRPVKIEVPYLVLPENAVKTANELLEGIKKDKTIVTIFPGASIPEKRWGDNNFVRLVSKLSDMGIPFVVIGGANEKDIGDRMVVGRNGINLAGKTSIMVSVAIINQSTIVVSPDSGMLHVACGLGKPTVSLFGPSNLRKWSPQEGSHVVITKSMNCSPCSRFGYTNKCSQNTRCMLEISVDEVVAAVYRLLGVTTGDG
jgi:lipopolysaccharide heptosyltransferase II